MWAEAAAFRSLHAEPKGSDPVSADPVSGPRSRVAAVFRWYRYCSHSLTESNHTGLASSKIAAGIACANSHTIATGLSPS